MHTLVRKGVAPIRLTLSPRVPESGGDIARWLARTKVSLAVDLCAATHNPSTVHTSYCVAQAPAS